MKTLMRSFSLIFIFSLATQFCGAQVIGWIGAESGKATLTVSEEEARQALQSRWQGEGEIHAVGITKLGKEEFSYFLTGVVSGSKEHVRLIALELNVEKQAMIPGDGPIYECLGSFCNDCGLTGSPPNVTCRCFTEEMACNNCGCFIVEQGDVADE
jgi:hypothetical protein